MNDLGAELDGTGRLGVAGAGGGRRDRGGSAARRSSTATTSPTGSGAQRLVQHRDRHVRRPRRGGQQRRLRARPHVRERDARTSGTRSCGCTSRATSACRASGRRVLARPGQGRRRRVDARIINTSSGAGLMGSVGQAAYSAAKAGIAALTLVQAAELGRYGVTANAIAPSARTRMTEAVFAEMMAAPDDRARSTRWRPRTSSPLVVWLGSPRVAGRHRPGVRGRGRQGLASPTAGSTAPWSTRAPAGIPPSSAPSSTTSSPTPPPPPRSTAPSRRPADPPRRSAPPIRMLVHRGPYRGHGDPGWPVSSCDEIHREFTRGRGSHCRARHRAARCLHRRSAGVDAA